MKRVLRFYWGNKLSTMSENRHRCYRSIVRNCGLSPKNIELITPDNYRDYEVSEHPIHEGFQYLSEVHKSDYLRAYIGYHYGGGWTDIKYCDSNWNTYYDMLESQSDKIGIGCREMIIRNGEYTYHDDNYCHSWCIAMSHYIFLPKTKVFKKYINDIDRHLDRVLPDLKKYPGTVHPMVCSDNWQHDVNFPDHLRDYKYPLYWMGISGYFFDSQLPYLDKIIYGMPAPHNFMTRHNHR